MTQTPTPEAREDAWETQDRNTSGLYRSALDHLRPTEARAVRVLSELVLDENVPPDVRARIESAFELSEDDMLSLARRSYESAASMLAAVLDGRKPTDPALVDALAKTHEILRGSTLKAKSERVVPLPGSPAWKRRAVDRAKGRFAEAERPSGYVRPGETEPRTAEDRYLEARNARPFGGDGPAGKTDAKPETPSSALAEIGKPETPTEVLDPTPSGDPELSPATPSSTSATGGRRSSTTGPKSNR